MTKLTLAQLRAIAEAATSGPWRNGSDPCHFGAPEVTDGKTFAYYVPNDADAAHIAAFNPAQCIALLDEIEELHEKLRQRNASISNLNALLGWNATDACSGEDTCWCDAHDRYSYRSKDLSHAD